MKPSINQALWFLTGGHLPDIHIPDFRKRYEKLYKLDIPKTTPSIEKSDLEIPASIIKFESPIIVNRMAIDRIRPVNILVPFHLTHVPVMGVTVPTLKTVPRFIRFTPSLIINALTLEISLIPDFIDLIKRRVKAHVDTIRQFSTVTIPAMIIPSKTDVFKVNPQNIPGYFIRINPTPFGTMERSELIHRRSIIADALNISSYKIELVRIFKNVDLFQGSKFEFDKRSRTLKVFPCRMRNILPERCDIIVGQNRQTNEIHIAKYKGR